MALQELPLPVVHLAQDSSREEKRSVALALLLVFTFPENLQAAPAPKSFTALLALMRTGQ